MKILYVSTNSELRRLRHFVLESAGFEVQSPETEAEASNIISKHADVKVLLICHTLANESARDLTHYFKQTHLDGRVLVLTRTDWESLTVQSDTRFAVSDGPEKLIEVLRSYEK